VGTALIQAHASNPDRLLEELTSLSRAVVRSERVRRSELYHRVSAAVRVARVGADGETSERVGTEDGTAVRLQLTDETGCRFAASTGSGRESVEQSVRRALDSPGRIVPRAGIRGRIDEPRLDRDPVTALPSPAELLRRLDDGLAIFRDSRRPGEATEPDEAWVEVASTVETWAVDGVPVASRTRQRGWALLRPAPTAGASLTPRPLMIAARSWDRLAFDRWPEARSRAVTPDEVGQASSNRRVPLLFDPETSASLALALVRSLHTGPGPIRSRVGPGWCVWNAPDARDALFGGIFDDSGVGTARSALADGERLVGRIDGAGHLRRPSFRDPPRPLPSHLLIDPPERTEAPDALRVEAISLHPLPTGEWVLDLGGAFLTTTPEELARGCVAGVGPVRSTHRGVETPALLFEGLEVRT